MNGKKRLSAAAAALVCVLAFAATAFAGSLASRQAKGLRNYEPYTAVQMKRAGINPADAEPLLEKGLAASPDFPPVYFQLARESLRHLPDGFSKWVYYSVEGIRAYGRNWWWSLSLSGLVTASLAASFVGSLLLTVLLRLPREFPLLKHDTEENPLHLFVWLGMLVISVFFGAAFFLGTLLMLLGLYFGKRDRLLVYLALAALVFLPAASGWLKALSSDSSTELRAVTAVNEAGGDSLALSALANSADFEGAFSYGLALKREGRLNEAVSAFSAALRNSGGKDTRAYVDLANCYQLLGNSSSAQQLYESSIAIRPNAEAFYNLALLNRKKFNFEKGDELFKQALKLAPGKVSAFSSYAEGAPDAPMDSTLGFNDFYRLLLGPHRIAWMAPQSYAAILWMLVFAFYARAGKLKAFRCSRCGKVLCYGCEGETYWGRMCGDCYRSLVKLEALDPKERVSRLLKIHGYQLKRGGLIRALSFAPPGIAYIYAGNVLQGMLMLWVFLFAVGLLVLNPLFTTGLSLMDHGWLDYAAWGTAAILYLVSFAGIRRRQGKGWL